MSAIKKQKIQPKIEIKFKQLFDYRFCDDLCEEILQYLSIKDKFRLECVSKHFQKNIYNRQYILTINEKYNRNNVKNLIQSTFDCNESYLQLNDLLISEKKINYQRLEFVLKKCPNIKEINSKFRIENVNEVLQTITNYCHRLQVLGLKSLNSSKIEDLFIESFGERFGRQLTTIKCPEKQLKNNSFAFCVRLLRKCPNLLSVSNIPFKHLLENNELLTKKVKTLRNNIFNIRDSIIFELNTNYLALNLSHLSIKVNDSNDCERFQLINSLSALKNLKSLEIDLNQCSDNRFNYCLQSIAINCPQIQCLKLIEFKKSQWISTFRFEIFKNLKRLRINCNCNRANYKLCDESITLEMFRNCSQLTHLSLRLSKLSVAFFCFIKLFVPKLIVLNLEIDSDINNKHFVDISQLNELRILNVIYGKYTKKYPNAQNTVYSLNSEAIISLLTNCNKLKTISINCNEKHPTIEFKSFVSNKNVEIIFKH